LEADILEFLEIFGGFTSTPKSQRIFYLRGVVVALRGDLKYEKLESPPYGK
jgi:hypothetical protein